MVVTSFVLIVTGCKEKTSEIEENLTKVTNVEIFKVENSTFEEYISLPVVVIPFKEADLGMTAGGKITKILVDKGDRVLKEGHLLIVDDVLLKTSLKLSKATLEYQRNEFKRDKKLFEEGSVNPSMFDTAQLKLEQAQSAYDMAKKQLEDATLKAPFSGIVTMRNVEIGEILAPGIPALRLIDISRVKVQAGIPERYIVDFKIGNDVSIKFDAIPGKVFKGNINFISPEASTSVRTFLAEIIIDNSEGLLRSGIMGDAQILRKVYEQALMIPFNSIIETQHGRIVFLALQDNICEERSIEIGNSNETMTFVTAGLNPGDRLIVKGQHDLVKNEQINITGEYTSDRVEGSEQ